jgi:hypothetical protein
MQSVYTIPGSCPTFLGFMRSLISITLNLLSCVFLASRRRKQKNTQKVKLHFFVRNTFNLKKNSFIYLFAVGGYNVLANTAIVRLSDKT